MVEISRPSVDFSCGANADNGGIAIGADLRRRAGKCPPRAARRSARYFISGESAARRTNGTSFSCFVGDRNLEPVAKLAKRLLVHLLGLMRDHLAFAGFTHAIALDGLCQNDRRLPLVLGRSLVSGVNLQGIVTSAGHFPDFVVAHMSDHAFQLGIFSEEVFADIGAVFRFVVLVFTVDALFHALSENAGDVGGQQLIPARAPQHLDDVPAGAAEIGFQFLHDLAVAAHRSVETLQIAIDHKHQIVEMLATAQRYRAERLRLVHLAVAHESPDLARLGIRKTTAIEVFEKPRLVDRHQRAKPHRHGGELPEIRQQPRVRIGRQTLAVDFLTEIEKLLLAEPALEKGAGIDAGRAMALVINQVAAMRCPSAHAKNA